MRVEHFPRCGWCLSIKKPQFYCGRLVNRCPCDSDYRTPIEARRDAVLDKYGTDPDAYTPEVLKALAKDGLLDIVSTFCPAGKLSMEETRAREARQVVVAKAQAAFQRMHRAASGTEAGTAETVEQGSVHEGPTAESGDAK